MHIKSEELINRFKQAGCTSMSKRELKNMFDTFCIVIAKALQNGEEVQLPSIGTLYYKDAAECAKRNPRTGELVTIPARKVLKIRAVKGMK